MQKNLKDKECIWFGNAANEEILHLAHLETARLVVVTVRGAESLNQILTQIHKMRPDVHVLVRAQYLKELEDLQINENTEDINTVSFSNVTMRFRVPRQIVTDNGLTVLSIDNDRDLGINTATAKSGGLGILGLNEDGPGSTFICPYSGGVAVEDKAVSLRLPGSLGYLGVLRNHAPLVTTVTPGTLRWRRDDGTTRNLEVGEGLFEVTGNRCTLLTNKAEEA